MLEEGRKKIRMCLIFVITAAVIIGFIYYFHDVKGSHGVNEGTLVKKTVYYQDEKTEVKKDGRKAGTVYIKADRNVEVAKTSVMIGDVLKIECTDPAMLARIRSIHLLTFHHPDDKRQRRTVVSLLKVIQKIHEIYPDAAVENIGETDFIVTYEEQDGKGGIIHGVKIVAVVLISFFGAAFSTMAFNNDVGVTRMFGQVYELLTGTKSDGFTILEFTYCIGIVIGILTFFNHFGKKRLSVDPTPMEVEMRLYENDIQTTLVETYSRKEKELDVGEKHMSGTTGI